MSVPEYDDCVIARNPYDIDDVLIIVGETFQETCPLGQGLCSVTSRRQRHDLGLVCASFVRWS